MTSSNNVKFSIESKLFFASKVGSAHDDSQAAFFLYSSGFIALAFNPLLAAGAIVPTGDRAQGLRLCGLHC